MRLSQLIDDQGQKILCATDDAGVSRKLADVSDLRSLALQAIEENKSIVDLVAEKQSDEVVDLKAALDENRVCVPIDHPDPAHLYVSGSGLSHGSWLELEGELESDESKWPDHLKTLVQGKRGGKPAKGELGAQPEWFYKGTGDILVAPGGAVEHPFFGDGPGEEAEIAGIYIIGPDNEPFCVGYCLGNEFSDEQMYFKNVYHLAQSKKRNVSLGPEVLIGDLPKNIKARISLERGGKQCWQAEFRTGEDNMLHSLDNIEAHYFKYRKWYRPGDIHVLYFGNAVMSTCQDQVVEDGDVFRYECDLFGLPLVNTVSFGKDFPIVTARPLW
ncbi:AraD1 family protein [Roseibium sp. SCP14]|uniref:AraD1 family protein n=1 Tax=Roseibium sp. SCP14 TaxID=3141375 RepID=UPI003338E6EB